MFTGIVHGTGRIQSREARGGDQRLEVDCTGVLEPTALTTGASVAVNGVCLTVVDPIDACFYADVSAETLSLTTLGDLAKGTPVNLEPALAMGDALGGHLMSGHVDGIGTLVSRHRDARAWRLRFRAPDALAHLIASKGSIAVDGVSLTVNEVEGAEFGVAIIPATLERTIADRYVVGTHVNLEVDIIARYLDRLLAARSDFPSSRGA
ncbi:MAG: riboflavin synthase [Gammaproteobacteria bacterium]